jgi:hypothetical protein
MTAGFLLRNAFICTCGGDQKCTQGLGRETDKRRHLEDLYIDERIITTFIIKGIGWVWIGLI